MTIIPWIQSLPPSITCLLFIIFFQGMITGLRLAKNYGVQRWQRMIESFITITKNILLLATSLIVLTENGNSGEFAAFKKQLAQKSHGFHYQMSSYFITSLLCNSFIAIFVALQTIIIYIVVFTNNNNIYSIMQGFLFERICDWNVSFFLK